MELCVKLKRHLSHFIMILSQIYFSRSELESQ